MNRTLAFLAVSGAAVVFVSPLLLGCQPPWLSGFLLAAVMSIGATYLLLAWVSGRSLRIPGAVLVMALLLLGWLSLTVLRDWHLGTAGGRSPFASTRGLCYAGAFFAAAILGAGCVRTHEHLKRVLLAAACLGVLLALTSLAQALGHDLKQPYGQSFYGRRINGIYTNPNRYAVLLAMCWLCCLAVGGDALTRGQRWQRSNVFLAALAACALAIAAAIVPTLSRLTMVSVAVWLGLAALWWIYLFRKNEDAATEFRNALQLDYAGRRMAVALLLPLLCIAAWTAFSLTLGASELQRRLSFDPSIRARFMVMGLALPLLKTHPLCGVGLSGFELAFAAIQPLEFRGRWREVHNDWLQLALEAGLPALLLALGLAAAWFRDCARRVRTEWKADQHTFALRALASGAVGVALLCSAGDFPLREPASGMLLFLLAGALCASFNSAPKRGSGMRAAMALGGVSGCGLLLAGAAFSARYSWAYTQSPWFGHIDAPKTRAELAADWRHAADLLPLDPELRYQLSLCETEAAVKDSHRLAAAAEAIDAAMRLEPRDFRYLAQAGRVRELQGKVDESAALREQAVERAPGNPWLRYQAGMFYIRRIVGGNLPGSARRETALDAAVGHLREVLRAEPTRRTAIVTAMEGAGCMAGEIARLWPGDDDQARIERARFYFERGQWADVDRALPKAVPGDPALKTWFYAISGALALARGEMDSGVKSWKLALRCNPREVPSVIPLEHWMLSQVGELGVDVVERFSVAGIEELRRYPGLAGALARTLISKRRYMAAEEVLRELSLVSADLCGLWAELALDMGDTEAAAQRARRAWEQELSSPSRAAWYDRFCARLSAARAMEKGTPSLR